MATEMFALDNKTLYALAGTGLNLCFKAGALKVQI